MSIDDTENIGMPIEKVYKVDKKKGKITVIDCELHSSQECEEVSREECEEGSEEYDKAEKEVKQIEETAEEIPHE